MAVFDGFGATRLESDSDPFRTLASVLGKLAKPFAMATI